VPTDPAGEPPVIVASDVATVAQINLHPPQPPSSQPMTQLPPTYPAVAPLVVVSDFADIVQISLCEAPPIFRDYVVETLGEVRGLFHISGNQHGAKVQGSWRWPTKEKPIKATKMFYKPCTPVDYVTPKLCRIKMFYPLCSFSIYLFFNLYQ
jgi:hypothetical protein